MKLFIKNMVCPRCVMSVEQLLTASGVEYHSVRLGEVDTVQQLDKAKLEEVDRELRKIGFELLEDPAAKMIEKVKSLLIKVVQKGVDDHFSIQKYLKDNIFKDYSTISKIFSQVEGVTIEHYFILQKIEKAKELLVYNEMALGSIASFLGYSSSQHLSAQFKQITGMTPTQFKSMGHGLRKAIDKV
ncbi:MAG TPA: helix-turn-helix domain-containing protein [Ginsengibacter sp.]|nr:helix-turn-helix domain-containing protein [Ginsengibacter sp.]